MSSSSPKHKHHHNYIYDHKKNRQKDSSSGQSYTRHHSGSKWSKMDNQNQITAHTIYSDQICQKMEFVVSKEEGIGLFQPQQDVGKLLGCFQGVFQVLVNKCMDEYRDLARQCVRKYKQVRQVLMHYPQSNHTKSYFHQMHLKSTETKMKLLKMLNDEQRGIKNLQEQNEELKLQVKQLKKLSKSKGEAYLDQAGRVKELQAKIQELSDRLADYEEKDKKFSNALKERDKNQLELKNEIKDKNKKLSQIEAQKENMKKDLNQIEEKMKSIKIIQPEPQLKKKTSRKICLKIPSKSQIIYDKIDQDKGIEEEFYRFLLIQACTIQEQL